jgi:hypothetical protein
VPLTCVLLQGEVCKAIICLEIAASKWVSVCWSTVRWIARVGNHLGSVVTRVISSVDCSGSRWYLTGRRLCAWAGCLRRRTSDHSMRSKMVLVSSMLLFPSLSPFRASNSYPVIIKVKICSCRTTLDVRELGIQFGCVRLIPFVQKGLSL